MNGNSPETQAPAISVTNLAEYEIAFERLESLMLQDPPEGSADEAELVSLAHAIAAFEKKAFPI